MANEFKHKDPCATLTSCEYIGADGTGHVFASQATGDLLYADSATVLNRLARACSGSQMLQIASCKPAWTATPSLGTTSWCNMNHAHGAANSGGTVCANVLAGTTLKSTVVTSSLETVGTLSALTVDDVAINGKVVTMTGSACDTIVMTAAANGAFSLVTTDTAAAAANITITADGTVEIDSAGNMTLDSGADVEINADGGCINFKDASLALAAIVNTSCVGELRIHEAANYIGLKPPALSANQTWTWPATKGSACNVLTCDGCGVLSFASAGGGAVSAINNATANELVTIGATTTELCAESGLLFDGTNLGIGTSASKMLHVLSSSNTCRTAVVRIESTGQGGSGLQIYGPGDAADNAKKWQLTSGRPCACDPSTLTLASLNDSCAVVANVIQMTHAGAVTMPKQPAFLAYNSVADSNVTGTGTNTTIDFDTEIFDQNADFASDVFTAPITGRYMVSVSLRPDNVTTNGTYGFGLLIASNRTWYFYNQFTARGGSQSTNVTQLVDMDACDTVKFDFRSYGESSDVVDIPIGACTTFGAVLLA